MAANKIKSRVITLAKIMKTDIFFLYFGRFYFLLVCNNLLIIVTEMYFIGKHGNRWVPLEEQELITLPELMSSPQVFSWVRVT